MFVARPQQQRLAHEVLIRSAYPDDLGVLARLARLDSQPAIDGDALIAEVDGVAVAALSLSSGRAVADPFVHTTEVCDLLRIRAAWISRPRRQERKHSRLFRPTLVGAREL